MRMTTRILSFSGIHNFRDYGDYATRGGTRIKRAALFRSSQHRDATADDLAKLESLSIATIIDLRGDYERSAYPCPRPQNFDATVLFAEGDTAGNGPHNREAVRDLKTAIQAHAAMVTLYENMPFRPPLIAVYRLYFAALATQAGPSLLHCLAGKDRTGIAVALLHDMLGVHPDDIMADYLLTNEAGNVEARIAAGAEAVRGSFGPQMEDEAVRTLMSVHPDFLETAFAAIRQKHGSLGDYCTQVLGVTPQTKETIKAALLA
jgi:protein-tyrosine phosphatase